MARLTLPWRVHVTFSSCANPQSGEPQLTIQSVGGFSVDSLSDLGPQHIPRMAAGKGIGVHLP